MALSAQEIGLAYEEAVVGHLLKAEGAREAYLWKRCPEPLLRELGIIESWREWRQRRRTAAAASGEEEHAWPDQGIDAVARRADGGLEVVQCKCYTGSIRREDLAGFFGSAVGVLLHSETSTATLYYQGRLTSHAAVHFLPEAVAGRLRAVEWAPDAAGAEDATLETAVPVANGVVPEPLLTLMPHQEEALDMLTCWYLDEARRGYLELPCGTGKTLIAGHFLACAEGLEGAVFTVPLLEHAHQAWERLRAFMDETWTVLLVDSEGSRNVASLSEAFKRTKVLVVSTFKSADVVVQLPWPEEAPWLVIVDEFHNLSRADVGLGEDGPSALHTLLEAAPRVLGLSATPRIYELETMPEAEEGGGAEGETFMGDAIYSLSWGDAIKQGLIADYRVWIPSLTEPRDHLVEMARELGIGEIARQLQAQITFLHMGMLNTGARRCIIYMPSGVGMKSTQTAVSYNKMLRVVGDWMGVGIWAERILSEDAGDVRQRRLTAFQEGPTQTEDGRPLLRFLLSVRILDECVDLPACDSVFFAAPQMSKVRAVQRAARAMRRGWEGKQAQIFVWCDESCDEQAAILSALKERDPEFRVKVKVASSSYEGRERKAVVDALTADTQGLQNYILNVQEYRTWEEQWTFMYGLLLAYTREHGALPAAKYHMSINGQTYSLGQWTDGNKHKFKARTIKKDREDRLLAIPAFKEWTKETKTKTKYDLTWDDWLDIIKGYISEHKRLPPAKCTITIDGTLYRIGSKLDNIKQTLAKGNMPQDQKDKLLAVKEIREWHDQAKDRPNVREDRITWDQWFDMFKAYTAEHNALPPAKFKTIIDGREYRLGPWADAARQRLLKDQLSEVQKAKILTIKIVQDWYNQAINKPETRNLSWEDWFALLQRYVTENNRLPSIDATIEMEGSTFSIGSWLSHAKHRLDDYTEERRQRLFSIEPFKKWYEGYLKSKEKVRPTLTWDQWFSILKEYVDRHGELPPQKLPTKVNGIEYNIGNWTSRQKVDFDNGRLKEERTQKMMTLRPFKAWCDAKKK